MTAILIIYITCILLLIGIVFFLLYKMNKERRISPNEFIGLLTVLSSQVQTEIDTYDKDIFINKGSITNNNFDNYFSINKKNTKTTIYS